MKAKTHTKNQQQKTKTKTGKAKTKRSKKKIPRLGPSVVQSHADGGLLVARVGADGLALLEVPEASDMIRGRRDEVRRVGREDHVPHPPLVPAENLVQAEVAGIPDLDGAVSGGGGKESIVREEGARSAREMR